MPGDRVDPESPSQLRGILRLPAASRKDERIGGILDWSIPSTCDRDGYQPS
ncbi:MAG TPA: hypothetical protein IGR64_09655 [Leptolyngbyaceae cyanobacterium M65_K2018_010]|nr:hypothetical protein [Leptolyngbyaceae cyanobacterium M65_K2018_010]